MKIKNGCEQIAYDLKIQISVIGLNSIPYLSFNHKDQKVILTYFNQGKLDCRYLTNDKTASFYLYLKNMIINLIENVYNVFKKKKLNFNLKNERLFKNFFLT